MPTPPRDTTSPLNIRIKQEQRSLIEEAAEVSEVTVSNFVRDAAIRAAENALLDQTTFNLDTKAWDEFVAVLDSPPPSNPRLRDLLSRTAPWDE